MKRTLALFALLALAAPVAANGEGTHITIEMHDDSTFTIDGGNANGALRLQPGETYEFIVTNAGAQVAHDWNLDIDGDGTPEVKTDDHNGGQDLAPGASVTISYTVPADAVGSGQYWCNPHSFIDDGSRSGMAGTVLIGGSSNGAPGPALVLILAGLALAVMVRRR